jgi:hypothetical protein
MSARRMTYHPSLRLTKRLWFVKSLASFVKDWGYAKGSQAVICLTDRLQGCYRLLMAYGYA